MPATAEASFIGRSTIRLFFTAGTSARAGFDRSSWKGAHARSHEVLDEDDAGGRAHDEFGVDGSGGGQSGFLRRVGASRANRERRDGVLGAHRPAAK